MPDAMMEFLLLQGIRVPTPHWRAAFISWHGGELSGPNTLDTSRGGFVISGWQAGSGDVFAERRFDRTATRDGATFEEDTVLQIRLPDYRP